MSDEMRLALENALERAPVAWEATDADLNRDATITRDKGVADIWRKAGLTIRPLYASPPALVAQREALEFCRDFKITDGDGKEVTEDSLHEIRKAASRALNATPATGGETAFDLNTPMTNFGKLPPTTEAITKESARIREIVSDLAIPSPIGADEIQDSTTLPTQMNINAAAKYRGKIMKTEVTFTYKNYRGETSVRLVRPVMVSFGTTGFHPEPQWLLHGWDINKDAERTFAMKDIADWEPVSV